MAVSTKRGEVVGPSWRAQAGAGEGLARRAKSPQPVSPFRVSFCRPQVGDRGWKRGPPPRKVGTCCAGRGRTGPSATALQPPPHLLTTLPAPAGGGRCVRPVALARSRADRTSAGWLQVSEAGDPWLGTAAGVKMDATLVPTRPTQAVAALRDARGRTPGRGGRRRRRSCARTGGAIAARRGRGRFREGGRLRGTNGADDRSGRGPSREKAGEGQREFSGQTEPASARRRRIPS